MQVKLSKVGIIGGSGVEQLFFTEGFKGRTVKTAYGQAKVKEGVVEGKAVVFLNRHGANYSPPSLINYRANIAALEHEGVEKIIATAAVGSIDPKIKPGEFVLLSDFIDFTQQRVQAFHSDAFVDLTPPYTPFLMKKIVSAADEIRLKLNPGVTYACTEGPRFETKAEIRMFRKLGADVVGMTQVPEVVLAAELGIAYAAIGVVTNFAAGVSHKRVSSAEVIETMKRKSESLAKLILQTIKLL